MTTMVALRSTTFEVGTVITGTNFAASRAARPSGPHVRSQYVSV